MVMAKLDEAAIFDAARQIKAPETRRQYVLQACAEDPKLQARMEALLRVYDEEPNFLDSPTEGMRGAPSPLPLSPRGRGRGEGEGLGSQIGPYKLIEQIGEGGFGVVFMAEQQEPIRRTVALKIVKPGMDTRQVIARFRAEWQALALMDHPNIAKVLDAGTTSGVRNQGSGVREGWPSDSLLTSDSCLLTPTVGRPYFVMELVEGVSITKYCDEHRLTPRDRLRLFIPICQAIQHAHQKGIIHRDLKPSNVLVAPPPSPPPTGGGGNGWGVPKVIDFGVAKALGHQLTDQTLTTDRVGIIGTLEYMSPEQAELGARDVDTRADIYSLGVLLYELLTGTTPLKRERLQETSITEVLRLIREEEPPKPSARLSQEKDSLASVSAQRKLEPAQLTQELRGELDWIVMKALEKDRDRRYATANGLARDIERHLKDETVEACPPSAGYRLRKFARKNRKLLTVATAFVLLLTAGTAVSLWQSVRATRAELNSNEQRDRAETESKRSRRNLYDAHMRLAQADWEEARVKRVLELLDKHQGEEDLRGFEWHYLRRLTDTALTTFRGHQGLVWSVAFSLDGKRLATAGEDSSVKVWDIAKGGDPLTLKGHKDQVDCVAFSPDGKQLASASFDRTVKLWDAGSGQFRRTLQGHADRVGSVAFSPDGKRLASAGHDGMVKVWDTATGMKTFDFKADDILVHGVAFSPDGKWLASASWDKMVKVWDASAGVKMMTLPGHNDEVTSIAFSPDGKRLASASLDRSVRIWDLASRQLTLPPFKGHTDRIFGVAFSPDGKRVASVSVDQTVKLWDSATGEEAMTLKGHTSWVSSVAFSTDGRQIASASQDGTVKVWDVAFGGASMMVIKDFALPKCVACSPDGTRIASAGHDQKIKLWDAASGRLAMTLTGHRDTVWSVAFSPDGHQLASASLDKTVKVWDAISGRLIQTLKGPTAGVLSIAFSPDAKVLAAASEDKIVRVWFFDTDSEPPTLLSDPEKPLTLHGHTEAVTSVACSPQRDDQPLLLASASADKTIKMWNPASGQLIRTLKGHTQRIESVTFSPDGNHLASGSIDSTVKVWDAATGREMQRLEGHTFGVNCVAFNPDGKRLASSSGDKMVKVWDTVSGQETLTLKGHAFGVPGVTFSPDGARLVSVGYDRTVRVWDARPWTPQLRIEQEARNLIGLLYAKIALKAEVIERIEQDSALSPEVRQEALEMTKHWKEDAVWLNGTSWNVVARRDEAPESYARALRQAEASCRLEPRNANYLNTLGVALYRNGRFREALDALTRSTQFDFVLWEGRLPAHLSFLAMAQFRLGNHKGARALLTQARWLMKLPACSSDAEAQKFFLEAAELIEDK
jgi:WD40 repeat protein/serine/threonine protein kinase